ncbi:MAG: 2,3-bisphosphoglycerate-independent phosphoglycerate mutase [Candidatus Thorarchaeota archaeon]|nr:MAG: 2,3-bisphosphoglycerate-independent phosphoglycerate mutase [Candidatus Thorarchaeota archaeon]
MATKSTAVMVVMDGAGDRPVPELGGLTPFQAAKTPNFDRLASQGQSGLMHVISPGVTPGSDTAHLALFGYDPVTTYPGRGPLEALGAGLQSKPGDVAFRANFATMNPDFTVTDRRAGREFTGEEGLALQKALDGLDIDGVRVHFVHTVEHRGALVLEGKGLSEKITDVDPHEDGKKVLQATPLVPEAKRTADVVNKLIRLSFERLRGLDVNKARQMRGIASANVLLLRGPGQHREVSTLKERFGIRSAVIAGGALYIGTAKYVGMEHIKVQGQTGTIDTNFDGIADKAAECVESDYDYVFVHIKATDNASHDHNAKQKVLAIERTDRMVGRVLDRVGKKIVIVVTADHTTPVTVGEHTCDPVPIVIWSSFIRPDSVKRLTEIDAPHGALHTIRGIDVLPMLLGYSGKTEKFGS